MLSKGLAGHRGGMSTISEQIITHSLFDTMCEDMPGSLGRSEVWLSKLQLQTPQILHQIQCNLRKIRKSIAQLALLIIVL
jgi:hypothetical protein